MSPPPLRMTDAQFAARQAEERIAAKQRQRISIAARMLAASGSVAHELFRIGTLGSPQRLGEHEDLRIKTRGALRLADCLLEEATRSTCTHDFVHGRFAFDKGQPVDLGSACASCGLAVEGGPRLVAAGGGRFAVTLPVPTVSAGVVADAAKVLKPAATCGHNRVGVTSTWKAGGAAPATVEGPRCLDCGTELPSFITSKPEGTPP